MNPFAANHVDGTAPRGLSAFRSEPGDFRHLGRKPRIVKATAIGTRGATNMQQTFLSDTKVL